MGADLGLFTPEFFQDPYRTYRRIQEDQAVLRLADGLFMVTRFEDCNQILRQPRRSRDIVRRPPAVARLIGRRELIMPLARDALVFIDEPEHGRTRRLMHKALTPHRVKELGHRVPGMVDVLIGRVGATGRMDVIRDLAHPLVDAVIVDLLDIPAEDAATVRRHAPALTQLTEPLNDLRATSRAARGGREMQRYLTDLVEARRRDPREDLVSALACAETDEGSLTTEQIVANCLLLLSNNEVTVGLIGNAILALLRHPEQLARFRDDPAIREQALDELLRYESPTPFLNRIAGSDDHLEGAEPEPGDTIVLAIAAANRDPLKFERPDELDLERPESGQHLAFGAGVHYCLAAPMARVVALPAISGLLERCPDLRLGVERPRFREQVIFHCLEALPVTFDATRA